VTDHADNIAHLLGVAYPKVVRYTRADGSDVGFWLHKNRLFGWYINGIDPTPEEMQAAGNTGWEPGDHVLTTCRTTREAVYAQLGGTP
jgi:hypothetical protein